MTKFQKKLFMALFILTFSVISINLYPMKAEALTQKNSTSSKHAEMNKKISAVQKKYQANEYDTYHMYVTYQVTAKRQDQLYAGYNKQSQDKIKKAKAKLVKYKNDSSLYAQSKIKELKRIILKEETKLKVNKVSIASYDKNYPIYQRLKILDTKDQKVQIDIITLNYNALKAIKYAYEQDTPVLFKCYDEIQSDLEMWKNSTDSHKEERISSLTKELENPNNGYLALNFKQTQSDELESSQLYYAFFADLYNIVKKYK